MIQCLGYEGGQIESLIAATSNEETDWTAVLQNIRKRHQDINNTKSLVNTIHLATPMLNRWHFLVLLCTIFWLYVEEILAF